MTTKVAFIGGGEMTLAFLRFFERTPGIEVVMVTDEFRDAPALRYAAEHQVRISTNIMDAIRYPEIDLIIELTDNRAEVLSVINDNLSPRTTLLTHRHARIMYDLLATIIENEFATIEDRFMLNIKDIKKSITDFAAITKNIDILAINASIEAARAGETGKGFAVVANSIKDLVKNSRDTLQHVRSVLEKLTLIHKNMQETRGALKTKEKSGPLTY
ncbi:MAG TPA: methyl-accepting chemotaxis protein [bacterium]|nr:methyl-accepting chemotaxis protein [bacterium]